MILRTISTVGLWAVVFAVVYFFGVTGGVVLLAVLSTLAQFELHGLLKQSGLPPWSGATLALGAALMLGAGFCPHGNTLWLAAAIALVLAALPIAREASAVNRLAGSVIAIAYVPGLMQFYALIGRELGAGIAHGGGLGLALWVAVVAKFSDVGGYLVGSTMGRHKLAPAISPGKTWEGAVGGLLLGVAVGTLGIIYAPTFFPAWLTPTRGAIVALALGVAAILSDLSESAFKRRAGVKDSGRCIPGMGGALDLCDSLLLPAPIAYYLFVCLRAAA